MKILVTGGAGYIGSVLVWRLLAAGHRVCVIDNFMYGQTSLAHLCAIQDLTIINGDARQGHILAEAAAGCDVIIPLAAIVGAPACDRDPTAASTTNLGAILELLRQTSPAQAIIIPTTNSGYGVGQPGQECTEDTPLNPISLYGRSKVEAERAVLERGNAISLRLATVFGMSPRMRLDLLVNDFVHRAVTDGALTLFESHFKRNYIHVQDVARAFLHAIDNFEAMRNRPYNVGLSSANLSKRELCERIKVQVPNFYFNDAPVGEDPDKRDYVVSNARIEAAGFRPAATLDGGITELIKGYRMLRKTAHGNV